MTQKPVFLEGIFTLRNLRSMGAAAIIEILIAMGIAAVLIWQQIQPVTEPPPVVTPIIDEPMPIPPQPRTVPVPEQPQTPHLSEVPAVPTPIPDPNVQPVQPPSLPPAIQTTQPSGSLLSGFSAIMLKAINDQKVYPKVSLIKGETGVATVSFDYVGGVVSNIHVDRSSGSHELDSAAIQAVQKAVLPPKPAELAGLNHFVFTLVFDLGN